MSDSHSTHQSLIVSFIFITNHSRKSCIVADTEDDSMILIGGEVDGTASGLVGRYNKAGKVENLPGLIYPRHGHGCAGYRDQQDKLVTLASCYLVWTGSHIANCQVVIVAGGVWPGDDQSTDRTELLLHSALAWTVVKPLPAAYDVLTNALLTVNNVVYLLGGLGLESGMNATDEVMEWNSDKLEWRQPGSVLLVPRVNHAVGAIPYSNIEFCE